MRIPPAVPSPLKSGAFTLYARPAYFRAFTEAVEHAQAGDRVLVTAMTFGPEDSLIANLLAALVAAAGRGAQVHFAIDANELMIHHHRYPGPLLLHNRLPKRLAPPFRLVVQSLERLRAAGVHVGVTNQPGKAFTNPYAGRSHIKAAVVNDLVFVGGCNLTDATQLDIMASWRDQLDADWLYEHMKRLVETEQTKEAFGNTDLVRQLTGDHSELIIDVGVRDQSRIYAKALQLIDQAEQWLVITCQYFPHSITAMALKRAAGRGVNVRLIFNHYNQHRFPHNLLHYGVVNRERQRMPKTFFTQELPRKLPFLHAKILASEKEAMIGSHNYVQAGVQFGTAEIALHVRGEKFAQDVAGFVAELTGQEPIWAAV